MTWGEFKDAVKVLLTVDAQRLNTSAFIEQHTRAAVQDLLHFIPFYRKDYVRTFLPTDFTSELSASRGELPPSARVTGVDILRRTAPTEIEGEGCISFTDGTAYLNDTTTYPDLSAGPITFECFAYVAAADTLITNCYFAMFDDAARMFTFGLANDTGMAGDCKLKAVLNFPVAPVTLKSTISITPDVWNHFAMVWDKAAGKLSLWINGKQNASCVAAESRLVPAVTARLAIGSGFIGKLDEVKFWNAARTKEHFSLRFNQWSGKIEPTLVAYYRFNDAAISGGTKPDFVVRCATTTATNLYGLPTLDGIETAANDRVLDKNSIGKLHNGIYTTTGAGTALWVRATDNDSAAEFVEGARVFITEGATLAGTTWELSTSAPPDPFILNVYDVVFTESEGPTAYYVRNEVTGQNVAFNNVTGWDWSTDHYPVIDTSTTPFTRYPCVNVAWSRRQFLINNMVEVNDQNGRIAIAPNGCRFYLFPEIQDSDDEELQMLAEVVYDTDAILFSDNDFVPYDEPMALCVADWVKGELARHIQKDMNLYASFLQKPGQASRHGGSYYQKRIQLFYRAKERGRVNDEHESGGPISGGTATDDCVISSGASAITNNFYTTVGVQTYQGAYTDPNGYVTGSVGDFYKSLASLGGDGQLWVKVSGTATSSGWE